MFQPKIAKPGIDVGSGGLDDVFRQVEEADARLATPTGLYAPSFYSRSEIRMSWDTVPDAAYYMIERAVVVPVEKDTGTEWEPPANEDFTILERFIYKDRIPYVDEILKNPLLDSPEYKNRYYYRVSAFNPAKNLEASEPCEPVYAMLFCPPSNVAASGGTSADYIEIRWEKSEGAVSYEIWRSASERGVPSLLGSVMGNQSYYLNNVDKNDQGWEFYYIILAANGFGNTSLQTKPAMGFSKMEGAPDAPIIRRSEGFGRGHSNSQAKIEWDPVDNAEYYAVYRFSTVDSSLTRVGGEITDAFLVDSAGLKPNVYYYYRVQAIGKEPVTEKELKSPLSGPDLSKKSLNELTAGELNELGESFLLSPPDTVVAEKTAGGTVNIKWTPSLGTNEERQAYIYTVYADTKIDGDFSTAVKSGVGAATGEDGYIPVNGLSVENGQFFRVIAFNGSTESIPSVVVTVVPSAAVIQSVSKNKWISPQTEANTNGVFPTEITWEKPENDEPSAYLVQRSSRPDGGFARINDAVLRADGTGTAGFSLDAASGVYTFIDKNDTAKAGKKFYYRVLSLNQLGAGNFYSEVLEGWGGLTHRQFLLEYDKTRKSAFKKLKLMYKSGSTDKLGYEAYDGNISGKISYDAKLSGLSGDIMIHFENYADHYIDGIPENGVYFTLQGDIRTQANISSNGNQSRTVNATGMYPGWVKYDGIEIKGGAAGGGYYEVQPTGYPASERITYSIITD